MIKLQNLFLPTLQIIMKYGPTKTNRIILFINNCQSLQTYVQLTIR